MAFNGFVQNPNTYIQDAAAGYQLVVNADGSINVDVSNTSIEISNDLGNPIPVSGTISTQPAKSDPLGYQKLSVDNVAVGLTVPVGADYALLQNYGNKLMRWRDDGVNPTSTDGIVFQHGVQFTYDGDLAAIKFIRAETGSAIELNVSYYQYI